MRTCVAPSSIATGKSCDIPIDNSANETADAPPPTGPAEPAGRESKAAPPTNPQETEAPSSAPESPTPAKSGSRSSNPASSADSGSSPALRLLRAQLDLDQHPQPPPQPSRPPDPAAPPAKPNPAYPPKQTTPQPEQLCSIADGRSDETQPQPAPRVPARRELVVGRDSRPLFS